MRFENIGRPMEILLVEDSLSFARITIQALRKGQVEHRMTWFADGNRASDFLFQRGIYTRAPEPDLILLDLGLPGKDGRELLREIKSDGILHSIPVVVMTASSAWEDMQECERLGVASYMTKPINLPKFLSLVHELNHYWHEDMIVPVV